MDGDRIDLSSDQRRLTNVARTDKLQQHRKAANMLTRAYEYGISQKQESIELKEILEKAKPVLPPKVKEAYDQLQDLHNRATTEKKVYNQLHSQATNDGYRKGLEDQLSHLSIEYIKGLKKLLEHLSPQTLQDYTDRGVEFVACPHLEDFTYGAVKDKIQFPFPYKEGGIRGTIMHAIELILDTEQLQDETLPSPERRIDIMARVFRANATLGEYGFPTEGYDLATKHRKDYNDGICLAFREGRISKNTPKEECIEIGYKYADNKLFESIEPPQGIPHIFPSIYPGGYFDERHRWEGQRPVQEGSPEFNAVMKNMEMRRKNRENPVLTANILWNDTTKNTEIWAQPYYITDGLRTLHPKNARGNHSIWAGEVEIDYETKTLLRLKDQSGHFRPFDKDNPGIMAEFALEEFKKRGYDTSTTMIELTPIEGGKDLKYKNYKPRTFGDLRAIGWQTESEYYIEDFRQTQQDS